MRRGFPRFGSRVERLHLRRSYCRLSAALPRWFLRFKFRRPAIKAFPFADLFRLYADLLRNLSGRSACRRNRHIRRALSRSGFRSRHASAAPLSFVFIFSFRALPRKCVKTGHVQNMVRFQTPAAWRNAPPVSLCSLFTMSIIAGKRAIGGNLIFPGKRSGKSACSAQSALLIFQRNVSDIPALPRAVIYALRKTFPLKPVYVEAVNHRFFAVVQGVQLRKNFTLYCGQLFVFPAHICDSVGNGLRDIQHDAFDRV